MPLQKINQGTSGQDAAAIILANDQYLEDSMLKKTEKGQPGGVAILDNTGKVPAGAIPLLPQYVASADKDKPGGFAGLDSSGHIPVGLVPDLPDYIKVAEKSVTGGVAPLDSAKKVPVEFLPAAIPNGLATLGDDGLLSPAQRWEVKVDINTENPAVRPTSPRPTSAGRYEPLQAGTYVNFGGIVFSQAEFNSNVCYILFDGVNGFSKKLISVGGSFLPLAGGSMVGDVILKAASTLAWTGATETPLFRLFYSAISKSLVYRNMVSGGYPITMHENGNTGVNTLLPKAGFDVNGSFALGDSFSSSGITYRGRVVGYYNIVTDIPSDRNVVFSLDINVTPYATLLPIKSNIQAYNRAGISLLSPSCTDFGAPYLEVSPPLVWINADGFVVITIVENIRDLFISTILQAIDLSANPLRFVITSTYASATLGEGALRSIVPPFVSRTFNSDNLKFGQGLVSSLVAGKSTLSVNLSNYYTKPEAIGVFVPIAGASTINGTKTFSSSPVVPSATLREHALNKGQADDTYAAKNRFVAIDAQLVKSSEDINRLEIATEVNKNGLESFSMEVPATYQSKQQAAQDIGQVTTLVNGQDQKITQVTQQTAQTAQGLETVNATLVRDFLPIDIAKQEYLAKRSEAIQTLESPIAFTRAASFAGKMTVRRPVSDEEAANRGYVLEAVREGGSGGPGVKTTTYPELLDRWSLQKENGVNVPFTLTKVGDLVIVLGRLVTRAMVENSAIANIADANYWPNYSVRLSATARNFAGIYPCTVVVSSEGHISLDGNPTGGQDGEAFIFINSQYLLKTDFVEVNDDNTPL